MLFFFAGLDLRFDIFSSLSLAHSFMQIEDVEWMISFRDILCTILLIWFQSKNTAHITFRFCFRLTKSLIRRLGPTHSKIWRKKKISIVFGWNVLILTSLGTFTLSQLSEFIQFSHSKKCLIRWRSSHHQLNACSTPFNFTFFSYVSPISFQIHSPFDWCSKIGVIRQSKKHKSLWCEPKASKAVNKLFS